MLSSNEIKEILHRLVFRDWEIQYIPPTIIQITAFMPNRDEDQRLQREDPQRRWLRSNPKYGHSTEWVANRNRVDISDFNFDPIASSYTIESLRGAIPIVSRHSMPENGFNSADHLVNFVYGVILHLSDHEIRENLYIGGERVLDPHAPPYQTGYSVREPAPFYLK